MNKILLLSALTVATFGVLFAVNASTTRADSDNLKVTICHWDSGQGGKYTKNDININSVSKCTNADGHDAHSNDIIPGYTYQTCTYGGKNTSMTSWIANDCKAPVTPTSAPTATPTQTQHPTATPTVAAPTATPTQVVCNEDHKCVTPTSAPTATPTPVTGGGQGTEPNNPSDGKSDGRSSCPQCTQAQQGVLGASTMAETGTFADTTMNFALLGGILSLALGGAAYAKEKKA